MTSLTKINQVTFSAFGLTVTPEWHHQDLIDESKRKDVRLAEIVEHRNSALKSNRHLELVIENLKEEMQCLERQSQTEKNVGAEQLLVFDATGDRQRATIQELQNQAEGLNDRLSIITDQRKLKVAELCGANEKIKSMAQENKSLEFERTHNLLRIQQLQDQVEAMDQSDRVANELIEGLSVHVATLSKNLETAQEDLDKIKEAYRRTLASNAVLDLKLEEAIAALSKTELQYNEQTVHISGLAIHISELESSRKTLLSDFDNSKQTVNISLDNHRIDMLKAWDNLELLIKGKKAS